MEKKLYRDELNKKVAGVCAGIADYLNVDVTLVRVIFALALVAKGGGALLYFVLWAVLPKKPYHLNNPNVDYTVPPVNEPFNPFRGGTPPFNPGSVPPFAMKPKKESNAGLVVGIPLVLLGSFFLLNQFDIIPFIRFHDVWPVVLIIIGIMVVISGMEKKPKAVEKEKWDGAEGQPEDAAPAGDNASDNTLNQQ
ncbi:PspC domain-containing protein [Mucilaginibacter calamicampi]|uniref:PspC domain-containing protein n=1 Tax=Mucilaginibacter calamicampi TaxID=1302352 RepID=A0ABW2YTL8_9SPHI